MGVIGLSTYVEKHVPDSLLPIDIRELILENNRTKKYTNKIVLDASSLASIIYGDRDWVCGGQLKEYAEMLGQFCRNVEELGCKIVVFFNGTHVWGKQDTWINRKLQSISSAEEIFDKLNETGTVEGIRRNIIPSTLRLVARQAFQQASNTEVRYTFRSNDEEVARYSKVNNCLALLAQDSDFLIYDCTDYYLSGQFLNIDDMTTKCYNKQALMDHMGLTQQQLPLFSTLAGNEIMTYMELKVFHRSLIGYGRVDDYRKTVLEGAAKFVKNLPPNMDMRELSKKICGSYKMTKKLQESINILTYNYKSEETEYTGEWGEVLKAAYELHRSAQCPPRVYNVLSTHKFFSSNNLEDFRDRELPAISQLLRGLRQNIYGILLCDERNTSQEYTVEEYCVEGRKNRLNKYVIIPVSVDAVEPVVQHPGLLRLWQDKDRDTITMKWKLFCSAISMRLNVQNLQNIKPWFVLLTSALYYLYNTTRTLNKDDVESFVKHAVQVQNKSVETLSNISFDRFNVRAVKIASIIIQTILEMEFLNSVCGHVVVGVDCCLVNFFDGKLFHQTHVEVQSLGRCELDDLNEAEREDFKRITSLIFQR